MKNLIKAQKKFNKMYENISNIPNFSKISQNKDQAKVVYKYGMNLLKMYSNEKEKLKETISKLHALETVLNLERKVQRYI